jgi:hypothetical protein
MIQDQDGGVRGSWSGARPRPELAQRLDDRVEVAAADRETGSGSGTDALSAFTHTVDDGP